MCGSGQFHSQKVKPQFGQDRSSFREREDALLWWSLLHFLCTQLPFCWEKGYSGVVHCKQPYMQVIATGLFLMVNATGMNPRLWGVCLFFPWWSLGQPAAGAQIVGKSFCLPNDIPPIPTCCNVPCEISEWNSYPISLDRLQSKAYLKGDGFSKRAINLARVRNKSSFQLILNQYNIPFPAAHWTIRGGKAFFWVFVFWWHG